ncbi:MAG: Transcriptional regulator SlyA [Phycisphaerae bacterium]|nr:Transcriptional regulator SlyA [Phycisphaerae bacterium]
MSSGNSRSGGAAQVALGGGAAPTVSERALRLLLRWSHIFSAAVQEKLESELIRRVCGPPLSVAQFHLLRLVSLNGDHQAREVASFLGVSAPAATKNIDKLVRLGLIRRQTAPDDRRALRLSAHPRGRAMVRRYEQLEAAMASSGLRGFREEEVELLVRLLERFSVGLFSHQEVRSGVCLRCGAHIASDCPVGGVQGGCPYQRVRQGSARERARPATSRPAARAGRSGTWAGS